jgi:hypothetical protein
MDAFGVLVEFGAARTPANRFDLGHLRHEPLGYQSKPVRLRKRNAWIELELNGRRALVERRQETARQKQCANSSRQHPACHDGEQH